MLLRFDVRGEALVEAGGPIDRSASRFRRVRAMDVPPLGLPLVDREEVAEAAVEALVDGRVVEIVGPPGAGKSALLRQLAHRAELVLPDGAFHCRAGARPVEDVLEELFEAFHRPELPALPTPAERWAGLGQLSALVLVDDFEAGGVEARGMLDALPGCRVVLGASRRQLEGRGSVVELPPLGASAAVALLERELGRLLRTEEHEPAQTLCQRLGGRPLGVLQAAAAVREGDASLPELAGDPVLTTGTDRRRLRALGTLSALDGAAVTAGSLARIADLPEPDEVLENLRARHLVEPDGDRYRLAAPLDQDLRERDAWAGRALDDFVGWTPHAGAEDLSRESEGLTASLRWGTAHQRWPQVLALARALIPSLALTGRWATWGEAARAALDAARALGDRQSEAWALNQLGVRALCRGERDETQASLQQAVALRHEVGDADGATLGRRNLDALEASSVARRPTRWGGWRVALPATAVTAGAIAGIMLARGGLGRPDSADRPEPPAAASVSVPASTPRGAASVVAPTPARPPGPSRPDLEVIGARARPLGSGGCTVEWAVRNRGGRRAGSTTTTLAYTLAGGGSGTTSSSLPALSAGARRTQRKVTTGYRCREFSALSVRADSGNRVREASEANNRSRAKR